MLAKLSAFICLALVVASATPKLYKGDKVFTITPISEFQLQVMRQYLDASSETFDFWSEPSFVGQSFDLRVSSESIDSFVGIMKALKLTYTVAVNDVQEMIDRVNAENAASRRVNRNSIVGTFPRHQEVNDWLASLCSENPTHTSCGDVGTTTEGRTIKYITIGNPSPSGAKKPKVWLEGTMHAREWLSTATVVYLVDHLLNNQASDADAKRMMDTYDWVVIPISNPDGYEYSHDSERLWRKTRSKSSANCYGVDPNRNWGYQWGTGGSSASPCSDTYKGASAFSEPETKALSEFIKANQDDTHVYFSLHSYSQLWLLPYGVKPNPSDFDELKRVADIGASALMAVNDKKWKVGNIVDLLYTASGGSIDWTKGVLGMTYSYCLELRPSKFTFNGFVVSASEIEPSAEEVWAGFVASIDAIPAKH